MQSSVATAVCGRCRRQCIAYGPKRRSRGGWRWTSNERNRQVDAVQPWLLSKRLALAPKVPAFLATVSVFSADHASQHFILRWAFGTARGQKPPPLDG